MNNYDNINFEKLRKDLNSDLMGAYFGGGYGAALIDACEMESDSDEELIERARRNGFNLDDYII